MHKPPTFLKKKNVYIGILLMHSSLIVSLSKKRRKNMEDRNKFNVGTIKLIEIARSYPRQAVEEEFQFIYSSLYNANKDRSIDINCLDVISEPSIEVEKIEPRIIEEYPFANVLDFIHSIKRAMKLFNTLDQKKIMKLNDKQIVVVGYCIQIYFEEDTSGEYIDYVSSEFSKSENPYNLE